MQWQKQPPLPGSWHSRFRLLQPDCSFAAVSLALAFVSLVFAAVWLDFALVSLVFAAFWLLAAAVADPAAEVAGNRPPRSLSAAAS